MPISNTPVQRTTLRVQVKHGAHLNTPTFAKLCPKVAIKYGSCQAHTTALADAGSAPTWPESFYDFPFIPGVPDISFELIHAPAGKKEELMADLVINLKETLGFDKRFDDSLHLMKKGLMGGKKFGGNLYVCMEIVEPANHISGVSTNAADNSYAVPSPPTLTPQGTMMSADGHSIHITSCASQTGSGPGAGAVPYARSCASSYGNAGPLASQNTQVDSICSGSRRNSFQTPPPSGADASRQFSTQKSGGSASNNSTPATQPPSGGISVSSRTTAAPSPTKTASGSNEPPEKIRKDRLQIHIDKVSGLDVDKLKGKSDLYVECVLGSIQRSTSGPLDADADWPTFDAVVNFTYRHESEMVVILKDRKTMKTVARGILDLGTISPGSTWTGSIDLSNNGKGEVTLDASYALGVSSPGIVAAAAASRSNTQGLLLSSQDTAGTLSAPPQKRNSMNRGSSNISARSRSNTAEPLADPPAIAASSSRCSIPESASGVPLGQKNAPKKPLGQREVPVVEGVVIEKRVVEPQDSVVLDQFGRPMAGGQPGREGGMRPGSFIRPDDKLSTSGYSVVTGDTPAAGSVASQQQQPQPQQQQQVLQQPQQVAQPGVQPAQPGTATSTLNSLDKSISRAFNGVFGRSQNGQVHQQQYPQGQVFVDQRTGQRYVYQTPGQPQYGQQVQYAQPGQQVQYAQQPQVQYAQQPQGQAGYYMQHQQNPPGVQPYGTR